MKTIFVCLAFHIWLLDCLHFEHLKQVRRDKRLAPKEARVNIPMGDFPWIAKVYKYNEYTKKYDYSCIGTLINKNHILVPGSCITDINQKTIVTIGGEIYSNTVNIRVVISMHARNTTLGAHMESAYKYRTYSWNDYLLQVYPSFEIYQRGFAPACLPTQEVNIENKTCHLVSLETPHKYKSISYEDSVSKHYIRVQDYPQSKCEVVADYMMPVHEQEMPDFYKCVVSYTNPYKGLVLSYGGPTADDVGAPLVCVLNGTWFQMGQILVASNGGFRQPTIYRPTFAIMDFITRVVGSNHSEYCPKLSKT